LPSFYFVSPIARSTRLMKAMRTRSYNVYIFIHQNGSIKRKNTYIQKYTINKNGSRNKVK